MPKLPYLKEKDFQAQVVELARAMGWLVYHPYDSRLSQEGYPDLTMVRNGRVIWAELKSQDGTVTGVQRRWLKVLPKGQAFLWKPSDWDAIVETLRKGMGPSNSGNGDVTPHVTERM